MARAVAFLALGVALLQAAPARAGEGPQLTQAKPPLRDAAGHATCVGVPSLSKHEIQMGILNGLPTVRTCYREALRRMPTLTATLQLEFQIAADGRPVKLAVRGPALPDAALQRCALRTFAGLRFKRPRWAHLGTGLHVVYPLRFIPTDAAGEKPPAAVSYQEGEVPRVTTGPTGIVLTLPRGAQAALRAAFPQHRLPQASDLGPEARGRLALPLPFAVTQDLDHDGAEELALVLIGKQPAVDWQLVVVHGGAHGPRLKSAVAGKSVLGRLGIKPGPDARGLFVTREGQCFCDRRCVAVASDRGRALELEWDRHSYRARVEEYVGR